MLRREDARFAAMTMMDSPADTALLVAQRWGDRLDVRAGGDALASTYRYGPRLPKACLHPLRTPAGHALSGFEPSDHLWHRGLWFTIKFVNGVNFWEEGDGHRPDGRHESVAEPRVELLSADAVRVDHRLAWTGGPLGTAIRERRVLTFGALPGGVRCLDWHATLTAEVDLELDRTPYTTWGGYGGLSWRAARELHEVRFTASDGTEAEGIAGRPHEWVVANARVDGGPNRRVALGIVDHPCNPRAPVPWYCKTGGGFTFVNAAFLFHGPMSLAAGESLAFDYRVLYRDGAWSGEEFAALAADFRGQNLKGAGA